MGSNMALNLAKKGINVTLFDINRASVDSVISKATYLKFKTAKKVTDIVEDSSINVIITVLPESSHVQSVYGVPNKSGLLSVNRNDLLFIDCTTGDINVSKDLAKLVAEGESSFVDAPLSGGVMGARDGTLTFMVGADSDKIFNQAKLILDNMGQKVFHCGKVGTGLAAKICNNMLLAISMIGTSEAMSLGINLGLDPKKLAEIINLSSGKCWSSEVYNPVPGIVQNIPSSRNYDGGFSCALMAKDLSLAQSASTSSNSPILLGSISHQFYRLMSKTDLSKKDFSVVLQYLKPKM